MVSDVPVASGQVDPTGNGLSYTSLYYMVLAQNGELTVQDKIDWFNVLESCALSSGVFKRSPTKADQQGPDDYVALMSANKMLGNIIHICDVIVHGINKAPKIYGLISLPYFYNTENGDSIFRNVPIGQGRKWYQKVLDIITFAPKGQVFNDSAWLGRQPQLRAHFLFSANMKPGWFTKLWWIGNIIKSSYAKTANQDAWMLSWFLVQVAPKGFLLDKAKAFWYSRREKLFNEKKGQHSAIAANYLNKDHPIAKYFKL